MLIDHGIDLDDLEAEHSSVVSDDLHGQVSFTIRGAATYRRSYARSIFGIDPIHIKRDVIAGGAAPCSAQRLFHHGAHSTLIDVAHGIDLGDAGVTDVLALGGVDVAHADDHAVLRRDLW